MLMTDAMVGSRKPCLQISEDEVDDRQILFGNLGIAAFGDGEVIVATRGEAGITTPVISDDLCAGRNRSLNEAAKRLRATVRDNGEPDTTGLPPAFALVELGPRSSLAACYRRVMRHRGHKTAVIAVAHRLLEMASHLLSRQVPYAELGAAYLDQRDREHALRRAVNQLERLGHRVILESAA